MALQKVDLPIDSMVIFHSYVTVYQRVCYVDIFSIVNHHKPT